MIYFMETFKRLFLLFAVTLTALLSIYLLFDAIEHARVILAYNKSLGRMWDLALAHTPTAIYQLMPVAALIAFSVLMLVMVRDKEYQVLLLAGQGRFRRLAPFVIFGLLVGWAGFWFSDQTTAPAEARYREIIRVEIKGKSPYSSNDINKLWLAGPSGMWSLESPMTNSGSLSHVKLYRFDEDFNFYSQIEAERMDFSSQGKWLAHKVFTKEANGKTSASKKLHLNLQETSEYFRPLPRRVETLDNSGLLKAAALKRKQGKEAGRYLTEYHVRLAYPWLAGLLALVVAGIAWGKKASGRPLALWSGLGLSTGAGLCAFFAIVVFRAAGFSGILAPAHAGWLPLSLLAVAAIISLRRVLA